MRHRLLKKKLATRLARKQRHRRLRVEALEPRWMLATTAQAIDIGSNDTPQSAQRLPIHENITITGELSKRTDVDFFEFWVDPTDEADGMQTITLEYASKEQCTDDGKCRGLWPRIGVFRPSNERYSHRGYPYVHSFNFAFDADEPGFWKVAITDYIDANFDGQVTRDEIEPEDGHTGAYRLKIKDATRPSVSLNVSAALGDNDDGSFGTFLPGVSLNNDFTVTLKPDVPDAFKNEFDSFVDGFNVRYQFGGENPKTLTKSNDEFTFSYNMREVSLSKPTLKVFARDKLTKQTEASITVNLNFATSLPLTATIDYGSKTKVPIENVRFFAGIDAGKHQVSVTFPTDHLAVDYKNRVLVLSVRLAGSRSEIEAVTISGNGQGTWTGLLNTELLKSPRANTRLELSVRAGGGNDQKRFTTTEPLRVDPIPKWMKRWGVRPNSTYVRKDGKYVFYLDSGEKGLLSSLFDLAKKKVEVAVGQDEAPILLNLLPNVKSRAKVTAKATVQAHVLTTNAPLTPSATLTEAMLDFNILGKKLKENITSGVVFSAELTDSLNVKDGGSLSLASALPITISTEVFPALNKKFTLPIPAAVQKGLTGGGLSLQAGADFKLKSKSLTLEFKATFDLEKGGFKTYVDGMPATFIKLDNSLVLNAGANAGLAFVSLGKSKSLAELEFSGKFNAALAARLMILFGDEAGRSRVRIDENESGVTLGLNWRFKITGSFLFDTFKKDFVNEALPGNKFYQLLGNANLSNRVNALIPTGKGVKVGKPSTGGGEGEGSVFGPVAPVAPIGPQAEGEDPLSAPQGTLQRLSPLTANVSSISYSTRVLAARQSLQPGQYLLKTFLVSETDEFEVDSLDLSKAALSSDPERLGFASADRVRPNLTIPSGLNDDEFYFLEFRFYTPQGDDPSVEVEILDMNVVQPIAQPVVSVQSTDLSDGLQFGPETSASDMATVTIANEGEASLHVLDVEFVGDGFEIVNLDATNALLPPGDSTDVIVRLLDPARPTNATLRVTTDALHNEVIDVDLQYDPASPVDVDAPQIKAIQLFGASWRNGSRPLSNEPLIVGRAAVDRIAIQFNESVDVQRESLSLRSQDDGGVSFREFTYNPDSNTATWSLAQPLDLGNYALDVASEVTDEAGNMLGELETATFSVSPGDATGEGSVSFGDLQAISDNIDKRNADATAADGDVDGDGNVTFKDFLVMANGFGDDVTTLADANEHPVLTVIDDPSVLEGTQLSLLVEATDPNSADRLSFSLVSPPDGASIDEDTGQFTYDAATGIGTPEIQIVVRVADDGSPSLADEVTFAITHCVEASTPIISSVADQQVLQTDTLHVLAEATTNNEPFDVPVFSLVDPPSGMLIDASGVISWTPAASVPAGTYTITAQAASSIDDDQKATTTFNVELLELNLPPEFPEVAVQQVLEHQSFNFTAAAIDPNAGQDVEYSLAFAPLGMTIDSATGELQWTPGEQDGGTSYTVAVEATDNAVEPLSSVLLLEIEIAEVNNAPVFAAVDPLTLVEGTIVVADIFALDPEDTSITYSLEPGAPAGVSIDEGFGTLQWPTQVGDHGSHTIGIRVTDEDRVSATTSLTITLTPEMDPPQIVGFIGSDTGTIGDNITREVTSISGSVADDSQVARLTVGFNAMDPSNFLDLLPLLDASNAFELNETQIEQLNGGEFAEGSHQLHVHAEDEHGNASMVAIDFAVDLTAPTGTLGLAPESNTGTAGDASTELTLVDLIGVTDPFSQVVISTDTIYSTATADESGKFRLKDVRLELGQNSFTAKITDGAGNAGNAMGSFTRTLLNGCMDTEGFGYQACVVTPEFNDISSTGTVALSGNTSFVSLDLPGDPFAFEFYGQPRGDIYVGRNGWVSFGEQVFRSPGISLLDQTQYSINPLWEELETTGDADSAVFWQLDGASGERLLTIQWNNVRYVGETETITFQVALDEADHTIQFNYPDLDTDGPSSGGAKGLAGIMGKAGINPWDFLLEIATDTGPNELLGTGLSTEFSIGTDIRPPAIVQASLVNDTGESDTDRVTMDPSFAATILDASDIVSLTASLNSEAPADFVDVTNRLNPDNRFTFDIATYETILGGPMPDGLHRLRVKATDAEGNTSDMFFQRGGSEEDFTFFYDLTAPPVSVDLHPDFDTDPKGDLRTTLARVSLIGTTEANELLALSPGGESVFADGSGGFTFKNVPISPGANSFTVTATDLAGNSSSSEITVRGPDLLASLKFDTGDSESDRITNDTTIDVQFADKPAVTKLLAGFNDTPSENFVDILAQLSADNDISSAVMETVFGGPIPDGPHTLHLIAELGAGVASDAVDVAFTLDSTGPSLSVELHSDSDTGTPGDNITDLEEVVLRGMTEPDLEVDIYRGGAFVSSAQASDTGIYQTTSFDPIRLQFGANRFVATAFDEHGNATEAELVITRPAPTDAFGYIAEAVTPEFIDVASSGTELSVDDPDDDFGQITSTDLGEFSFDFYGTTYDSIFVSTNGLITFASGNSDFSAVPLDKGPPQAAVAVLWDDLDLTDGSIFWEIQGSAGAQQLIIQWDGAIYLDGDDSDLVFQAVFSEADDSIQLNYQNIADVESTVSQGASASVGIKDAGSQAFGENVLAVSFAAGPNELVASGKSTRISIGDPLLAANDVARPSPPGDTLSEIELQRIAAAAVGYWQMAGISDDQLSLLNNTTLHVADLHGSRLGLAASSTILVDHDAAGHGWYIDTTPEDSEEFGSDTTHIEPADRMDLLTVVLHEMGHLLGLPDLSTEDASDDLMYGSLDVGVRRTPGVDEFFAQLGRD